jgi:hypothetical protein
MAHITNVLTTESKLQRLSNVISRNTRENGVVHTIVVLAASFAAIAVAVPLLPFVWLAKALRK